MKKCPYCAEEVQDEALVCKHCKSPLPGSNPQTTIDLTASTLTKTRTVDWEKLVKWVGIAILVIVAFKFWYIGIPAAVVWYLFKKKKHKYSRQKNLIITASVLALLLIIGLANAHANRTPKLTVTEPQNQAALQAKTVAVKGTVEPSSSSITVNGKAVKADGKGGFSYDALLNDETNTITVVAANGGKNKTETLTITRIFTAEEMVERQRLKAEAEAKKQAELEAQAKAQAEAEAKAKAEQVAYDNSKAGKLCKAHLDWSKDDCQTIADGKVHVGMNKEQAIAAWGQPSDINTTSSALGTHEQWVYNLSSYLYFDDDILTTIQN